MSPYFKNFIVALMLFALVIATGPEVIVSIFGYLVVWFACLGAAMFLTARFEP